MTSLNPTTGKDDGFLHLSISGNYQFPGVTPNATRVYNQQLSHSGSCDLVEGDFTIGRRTAPAADLHAEPDHQPRDRHRLDVAGVGRQPW